MKNRFNHCFSKLSFSLLYFPAIFMVKIFISKEELKKRAQQTPIYSLLNILLQNSLINILSDVPTFYLLPFCPISPFLLSPLYAFYTHTHNFVEPSENSCKLWYFVPLSEHESENMDILLHNYSIINILKSLIFVQYYHLIQSNFQISLDVPEWPLEHLPQPRIRSKLTLCFFDCHVSLASFNLEQPSYHLVI